MVDVAGCLGSASPADGREMGASKGVVCSRRLLAALFAGAASGG